MAGFTVFLYLIDPQFEANAFIVTSMVLVSVWAFFFVPALPFTVRWVKNYFENLNFQQSFRFGYFLGCGWGVIAVLLFLVASPVIGMIWFIQTIKSIRISFQNKRAQDMAEDIFDL